MCPQVVLSSAAVCAVAMRPILLGNQISAAFESGWAPCKERQSCWQHNHLYSGSILYTQFLIAINTAINWVWCLLVTPLSFSPGWEYNRAQPFVFLGRWSASVHGCIPTYMYPCELPIKLKLQMYRVSVRKQWKWWHYIAQHQLQGLSHQIWQKGVWQVHCHSHGGVMEPLQLCKTCSWAAAAFRVIWFFVLCQAVCKLWCKFWKAFIYTGFSLIVPSFVATADAVGHPACVCTWNVLHPVLCHVLEHRLHIRQTNVRLAHCLMALRH